MYKTKKDVDVHVRTALSKLRSESDRQLRSFTIAKLYYKINEYSSAEQYLCSYLSAKEDNDQAHKLLGQCYQRLKKPDKALQSYQRSLQLSPKQPDILAEVCQLLLEDKNINTHKANYWCELAESEKVQHDAVFSLRLKLMNRDNVETNQVEDLIQREIMARPQDVHLRVRLVRNFIDQNKLLDAFKYIQSLEMSQLEPFSSSAEWYNIVWLVLSKYEQMPNSKKDWDFWLLLANCLERQVYISFLTDGTNTNVTSVTETANLLFNLDQYLFKINQLSDKLCAQKELVSLFLHHYRGQLLLHSISLIFKRELLQNKNKWKETVKAVLPLMLLAVQIEVPTDKNQQPWMKHCDEQGKHLIHLWSREGAFRCAQIGRTMLSCIADESSTDKENAALQLNNMLGQNPAAMWANCDELLSQIRQTCSDKQWRRNVFSLLFCNSDQKIKEQSSLLIKSSALNEPVYELPTYAEVESYEETAQYLKPQSLQHMVYLCLGNDNLAFVRAKYFSGLNFSVQNLAFCGAESLNQLDMDSFMYASAMQAKRALEVEREAYENYNSGNRSAVGKPRVLPFANLQSQLCSEEQCNWWMAAYQMYKNLTTDNLAELRANLQYGIEAVRGINGPKVDMVIVFKLGQLLVSRAQDMVKPVEKAFLEARAESIYKYGLNMMKMNQKGVLEPYRKYFKYPKHNTSAVEREVATAAEDAVSYLATRYFKKAEYEELIEELTGVQLPFATYLQAEAYRKIDEANKTPRKAKRMYYDRVSECLNQTLALLKNTQTDPNHPLNSVIHAELKRLQLSGLDRHQYSDSNNAAAGISFSPNTHNNSSTVYEDAEDDFFSPTFSNVNQVVRSRREAAAAALLANNKSNEDLEQLVKQMCNTLSFVKEEIVETIKPSMISMRKEISTLTDEIANLKEAMKKTRISSNPPSRDDASHVLDDLYMIEDALYQQATANVCPTTPSQPQLPGFPSMLNGSTASFTPQQQQSQPRHTPNMQMQQAVAAAAAAYNSPMFNPNYPLPNYYNSPYMITQQGAAANAMLASRNPLSLPYMDCGMNFNMPPTNMMTCPPADNRNSNLYNLLGQAPVTSNTNTQLPHIPQLSVPLSLPSLIVPPITTSAVAAPNTQTTAATVPPIAGQYNKTLNNQPVEKGAPANVVITSSDPLPNPNLASQSQQPTLSVTIPSHHIKQSLVSTPEAVTFGGFGLPTASTSMFASVKDGIANAATSSIMPSSGLSSTTFSFKPQIAAAAAAAAAANATTSNNDTILNKTNESFGSELNKTDPEAEYDPRPDFKPIIPLPDEIEVKTGEEDEVVMFCYRAKLFRHVDKEWKERGIGDIKILKSKEGTSRILMRRDQTHKICANHKITAEMKVNANEKDAKSLIWIANDFADETLQIEKFFVRFKMLETAKEFLEAFEKAIKEAEDLEKNQEMKPPEAALKTSQAGTKKAVPPFGLAKSGIANFTTSTPAGKSDAPAGLLAKPNVAPLASSSSTDSSNASKALFASLTTNKPSSAAGTTEKKTEEAPKPFANFTFDTNAAGTTTGTSPFANIFGNASKSTQSPFSTSNLSFSPLATTVVTSSTTTAAADSSSALNKSQVSDNEEEYVPTAQFNPVIPLPDLVEVTTGEENEIVLFEHRAKLLRFDKEAGEWKERGLGNIKLLQDKSDVNKVRLVMRRDQIHKLCCNQRIYKNTSFNYAKNSSTAISWAGQDYSENELITEMLTVRFKTAPTCKDFLDATTKAQANMTANEQENNKKLEKPAVTNKDSNSKGFGDAFKPKAGSWNCQGCYLSNAADQLHCKACNSPKDDTVPKKETASLLTPSGNTTFTFGFGGASQTSSTTTASKPAFNFGIAAPTTTATSSAVTSSNTSTDASKNDFGSQFIPKAGSWDCQGCYLNNAADVFYCKACEAPKDNTIPKKEAVNDILAPSNPSQKFNFGFGATSSLPASFGSLANSAAASGDAAKSFTFTPPSATSTSLSAPTNLGKPTFNFSLQSKAMEAPTMPSASEDAAANSPYSLDKKEFSFTLKPKSPGKSGKSPAKLGGGGDADGEEADDGDYHEEEENNTYFTPVIPLPDKIDVKTGEEGEELLYVHRAKLYRHADGEWKERGLGDVKILRHKETKKLRVVMRRDQIWKICLNHVLNNEVEYKVKDDKSWLFVVNDFSEGEMELQKFSLRFKAKDVAQDFMTAVKKAIDGSAQAIDVSDNTASINTSNTSTTTKISTDDKQTADRLQLPYEFYTAQPTTCEGCRGCSDKDVKLTFDTALSRKEENALPLEMPVLCLPNKNLSFSGRNTNRSLLKQSALSPAPVTANNTSKANESIFSAFGGANSTTFGSASTENKPAPNTTFSFASALNNASTKPEETTTVSSGGFLFGNTTDKPVFGQSPLFGSLGSQENTNKPSIFGGSSNPTTPITGSVFENKAPIFGGTPIFGGANTIAKNETSTKEVTTNSIFGTSAVNSTQSAGNGTGHSIFGSSSSTFSGLANNTSNSIFGSVGNSTSASPLFGGVKKEPIDTDFTTTSTLADLSSKAGAIDFASLAANATTTPTQPAEKPGPGGFIGLTNHNAFSSFLKTGNTNNNSVNSTPNENITDANANESYKDDDNAATEDNYDPHYEPIIELPKEIVVSTGEEEETKLFGERATLYRWDATNKEWKERGVGELKLLQHSTHQTYRLVMRREQIHKLVLNHAVGADFIFNNMNNNPKSFVWAAMNYAESSQGELEKLAVRFKKIELAEKFAKQLKECIQSSQNRQNQD